MSFPSSVDSVEPFISFIVQTQHIGCYADKAAPEIPSLEGKDPLLDGEPETRKDAEQKCARVALKRGYVYFAIQDGGHCHSSLTAQDSYNKYGLSLDCKLGKGGKMASDVYEVIMFSKYKGDLYLFATYISFSILLVIVLTVKGRPCP